MKYGYARVSTDGQSVDAQVKQPTKAGCPKAFSETESSTKSDRRQLRRLLDELDASDVLIVTRLNRLARSTRDLLNTLLSAGSQPEGNVQQYLLQLCGQPGRIFQLPRTPL